MSQQGGFNKGVVNKQGAAKMAIGAKRTGMSQRDGEHGVGTPPGRPGGKVPPSPPGRPGQQPQGFKQASVSKVPGTGASKGVVMGTRKPAPPPAKSSVPMAPAASGRAGRSGTFGNNAAAPAAPKASPNQGRPLPAPPPAKGRTGTFGQATGKPGNNR